MRKLLLALSALLLLTSAKPASKQVSAPAWFWQTPSTPGTLSTVGYSQVYGNLEASYQAAFQDAARRLAMDRNCRIIGGRASGWDGWGMMSFGAKWKFEVDTSDMANFIAGLVRVDSAIVGDLAVMLVTTKLPYLRVDSQGSVGEVSGSGSAPIYYHSSSSWIEAEREARIEAATNARNRIRGIQGKADEISAKTVLVEADVALKAIRTVRRSYDPEKKIVTLEVVADIDPVTPTPK